MTILDPARTTVRYNSEWLSHVNMSQLIEIAGNFTPQQFLARDNFRLRYERGDTIRVHEFLYPLMQGYDAVFLRADVQLGATEQLFNLMAGRRLQEAFGQQPQVCITYPILPGTDGVTRMSKSAGNYIGIAEPPAVMYRKIMELPATVVEKYFHWTPEAIADLMSGLALGVSDH